LEKFCCLYWYPLYACIRRRGHDAHDAEDLTQEFSARLLKKNSLAEIQPEGGRGKLAPGFESRLVAAHGYFAAGP
jgi:RNA polymerase sigma-70 factor (ECF subfamily)